jgi:AcrR family transcriptional regulator
MGRSKLFQIQDIHKGLCNLLKNQGLGNFSMQVVAKELDIPIGSLYHRYHSKVDMMADLWLSIISSFQNDFEKSIKSDLDPMLSGKVAAVQIARWMEKEPEFAYLLSNVRKEDLNYEEWSPTYRSIERRQKKQLKKIWNDWVSRIKKSKLNEEEFFIFKTVIVDIPIHICKPFIGKKFPSYIFKFIEETFQHQISNLKLNQ